jgi:hypothetical protein
MYLLKRPFRCSVAQVRLSPVQMHAQAVGGGIEGGLCWAGEQQLMREQT